MFLDQKRITYYFLAVWVLECSLEYEPRQSQTTSSEFQQCFKHCLLHNITIKYISEVEIQGIMNANVSHNSDDLNYCVSDFLFLI